MVGRVVRESGAVVGVGGAGLVGVRSEGVSAGGVVGRPGVGGGGGPVVSGVVLFVGSVLLSLVFWPGHMDADALNQISEARSGKFTDWWAPVLDWLWRGLFLLHVSPGFVLWATIAVFVFAVYELLRLGLGRRAAVVATLLIAVFPPVLGYLGSLQRDVWFGASTLAAYALVARAQKSGGAQRTLAAVGALVAIWFALAARQNALIAVLPAALMVTNILVGPRRRRGGARWAPKVASLFPMAVSVVLLGIFVLSQQVLTYHVIGAVHTYPQQEIFEGDLASLSVRTGKVLVPPDIFPSQNLNDLRSHYSPYSTVPLIVGPSHPLTATASSGGPGAPDLVGKAADRALEHDWIDEIRSHPMAYLHERWHLWTRLTAWNANAYEPYHPEVDPNPWGYKATYPSLYRFAGAYLSAFSSGPLEGGALHRVWVYLALAGLLAVDLLRRGRPKYLGLVGWLCAGSVVYFASFFFLGMGVNFRWSWLVAIASVIGLGVDGADCLRRAAHAKARTLLAIG